MKGNTETSEPHSRLLRCSLCIDESRAYWANVDPADPRTSARYAFARSWFGNKSEAWTTELLSNMRVRFDAFPSSLRMLAEWTTMSPDTRRVLCHFHLQLTDPLYRSFTGEFLPARRDTLRLDIHRQTVIRWTAEHGPVRWGVKTQLQFAKRILSCSAAAGLLCGRGDPRQLVSPRVPDQALEYILYTLRGVRFTGSFVENPYLASLNLAGDVLAERLRALPSVQFRKVADVHELGWRFPNLEAWAAEALDLTTQPRTTAPAEPMKELDGVRP